MDAPQLRRLMDSLRDRVTLEADARAIRFDVPTTEDLRAAGFDPAGIKQLLGASWWKEMIEDIVETPEFCGADESRDQLLAYARDVVTETLQKRFKL